MFKAFAFGFETRIKTILPLINQSLDQISFAGWLLNTFQSDATSAHWHPSLVSDKHVPACRCLQALVHCVVLTQPGIKVNGTYYCDILLLKQLLPYIYQATDDFYIPAHHACTRALSCCDTRLRTSHQTCGLPTDLTSVLMITGHWQSFRNAYIRNSNRRQTSLMSCGY